jgi:dolichol-phosphate mannosyltransferase
MSRPNGEPMSKDLSLIVPTYNEVDNIEELIERIAVSLKHLDFEIIFVDDGSTDGTVEAIERFGKVHGDFRVVRRNGRRGLSLAVMDGVKMTRSDVVSVIDGDLQHPPEFLPQMLAKITLGFDLVIASRYVENGAGTFSSSARKRMSKLAVNLAHFLLPKTRTVEDVVSGFFMFRKQVLKGAELSLIGNKILLEIISQSSFNSVTEVPYSFAVREKGKSKLGLADVVKYVFLLVKLRLNPQVRLETRLDHCIGD